MPDWKPHIRSRLASLRLSSSRENEIIEELSQHLEVERWRELVAGGASEDEATKLALAGFREGDLLARHLAPLRQAHAPEPITPGASAGHLLGDQAGPPSCRPHAEEATNRRARGHPDTRPRHRRQHRHFYRGQRHTPATPASA